jgi:hypothetical protein
MRLASSMSFFITHIYSEGNHCADKLAAIGLSLNTFFWWDNIPSQLSLDFVRNRLAFHILDLINLLEG